MPRKARISSAYVTKSTSFLTCLAYRCVSRAMRSNMSGVKGCSNSWVGVSSDNLVLSSDFILSGAEPGRLDDVYFGMHFFHTVPRQFVYGHFVYDTSSTDISSTDISSTTVYQRTGQLYIQLLFQQITIFINSNSYLHYDSFLSIQLPLTL